MVMKFSSRERAPFLKVIDIWDQRQVLSSVFLQKLRDLWNTSGVDSRRVSVVPREGHQSAPNKRLLSADPKLCDPLEATVCLSSQMCVTSNLLDELERSLPPPHDLYSATPAYLPVQDPEILKRVLTSLCSELNVCRVILS